MQPTKDAGFDYFEIGVKHYARLSDDDFQKLRAQVKRMGVAVPFSNSFIPSDLPLVGPHANVAAQNEYLSVSLARAKLLGVTLVVFGSGPARSIPEGFARDKAILQLIDFGRRAANEARRHNIVIVVEPLQSSESNILNTAAECLAYVNAVERPNFELMIDFFHMAIENEDPSIILRAGSHIRHLHIANPHGRAFPVSEEESDYATFFANLAKVRYHGGVSVEARSEPNLAQVAPQTLRLIRGLVAKAYGNLD